MKKYCYLTENEEITEIDIARKIASMGLGITKTVYLDVISAILQTWVDQKDFLYSSMMVLDRLIKKYKELVNLLKCNAIGPAWVRQADEDVKDVVFIKIENYIRLLQTTGKVPWKTFGQVPKENIYNIDKVATHTSKYCKKIIW